jgi:AraC-like DNA-binding protein
MISLWKVIESYDIDPAPLFAAENIEISLPIGPDTRTSYAKIDRIRSLAAQLSGDPDIGLRAAQHVHPSQLGALGYAWLASSSLRTAFLRLHRYIRFLNDQGHFNITEEGEDLVVSFSVSQSSNNMKVRDDAQMAVLVTLCRMNYGKDFNPLHVGFKHERPADIKAYQALFRCRIKFGCEYSELALPLPVADEILPTGNPELARLNEQVVTRRLAHLDRNNIPNRVRAAILEQLPSGNVSEETVARELHMASRTLLRRLTQDGQSFRAILAEVRKDLAEQYIHDLSLTLTEITFLLGFSEASSFSRAFKNWKGTSPSAARQKAAST